MPRVPVMSQLTPTECGPCCLAMVLGGLGRATTIHELRPMFDIGRDGTSARRIVEVARACGLVAKGLKVIPEALGSVRVPAIAHWRDDHFTVVEKVGSRHVRVVDPLAGRRRMARTEFVEQFGGIILEFDRSDAFERRRRRLRDHLMLRFLRDVVRLAPLWIVLAVVLSGFLQALGLASAWATKYAVDTLLAAGAGSLTPLAAGVGAYLAARALTGVAREITLLMLQRRLDGALGRGFMSHLTRLPFAYFQNRGVGELTGRLESNTVVREVLTSHLVTMILDGVFVAAYTALLLAVSPGHAAMVAVLSLAQLAIVGLTFRPVRRRAQREQTADAAAQSSALDALVGAEFLKASGLSGWALRRWIGRFTDATRAAFVRRRWEVATESALAMVHAAVPLVLLLYGVAQVRAGETSTGTMLALNVVAGLLLAPVGQLLGAARYMQVVGPHLRRVYDVLQEVPEPESGRPGATVHPNPRGDIELTGVDFRYSPTAPFVLRDVSFTAAHGSKVAIVGATGAGKTTLIRLLCGLLRPDGGTILLDSRPFDRYDGASLGVVTQFPYVVNGSIRENLTMGMAGRTDDELREALRRAQFLPDLDRMPRGLRTPVGEGGAALSGGQRQRLAIARVLLRPLKVLLLDEATSHLDALTEAAVSAELAALGCTRIVASHRISTVRDADHILVLHLGEIVEQGTHENLLALGGRYAALVHCQTGTAIAQAAA